MLSNLQMGSNKKLHFLSMEFEIFPRIPSSGKEGCFENSKWPMILF
jgi:hypothetical protein